MSSRITKILLAVVAILFVWYVAADRIAELTGARHLVLFHHDPWHDDRQVEQLEEIEDSVVVGQKWDNDVRVILFVKLSAKLK